VTNTLGIPEYLNLLYQPVKNARFRPQLLMTSHDKAKVCHYERASIVPLCYPHHVGSHTAISNFQTWGSGPLLCMARILVHLGKLLVLMLTIMLLVEDYTLK